MKTLFNISGGPGPQSDSSGHQTVPNTGVSTLIASLNVAGMGMVSLNGVVESGSLTDFVLATAVAVPSTLPALTASGKSVPRLVSSAGDFVVSNLLNNATANPHATAAGSAFYCDLDLKGRYARVDLFATSTAGAVITIDATGVGMNVG